jgi:hypothetical protein
MTAVIAPTSTPIRTIWIIERFRTRERASAAAKSVTHSEVQGRRDPAGVGDVDQCRIHFVAQAASGPEVEPRRDPSLPELELVKALTPVKAELRCAKCGYGVIATEAPEACPMCQAASWEPVPWRPFSRLTEFPSHSTTARARREL